MKIEKKVVDVDRGIVQVTTTDERWYAVDDKFLPSVTWIAGHYPKGTGFYKWLASKGWDEAESIKISAGDRGSKVHQACEAILRGDTIEHDGLFMNHSQGAMQELTPDEYEAVMSFVSWLREVNPEILGVEYTTINEDEGYAGTVDIKARINGEIWIVDIKTSQDVWPEYELQLSAYKHSDPEAQRIGILQVGYRRNVKKFKFTELADKFQLFLAAKQIWANECAGISPLQRDFPLSVEWKWEKNHINQTVKKVKKQRKVKIKIKSKKVKV